MFWIGFALEMRKRCLQMHRTCILDRFPPIFVDILLKIVETLYNYRFSIILTETRIFGNLSFYIVSSQSILTQITVGVVGSFHGFGNK